MRAINLETRKDSSILFDWTGRIVRYLVFPTLLFTALYACQVAFTLGISGFWVFTSLELAVGGLLAILERLYPFDPEWNNVPATDMVTDALHFVFSSAVPSAVISAFILTSIVAAAGWLSSRSGTTFWPDGLPFWIQVLLAALIADLALYWIHRYAHRNDWLWRIHAIHHSSGRLYWLAAYRTHPGNILGAFLGMSTPLILLGCPGEVIAMVSALGVMTGLLQHSNVDARMGPLNWVINSPELHRFHHSTDSALESSNFGASMIVWDVVFGTRFLPKEMPAHLRVGIKAMQFPKTYLLQLAAPFIWKSLAKNAETSA
jgi:sterol desaturase/sphingolipid hydroxylase (fatty acid hydroxylase superfamily)